METPQFRFSMPLRYEVIEEKGEEKIILFGNISTNDMDLVNDIVTKNCLESMKSQMLERNMKLDIEHEAFRGMGVEEKEINKTKIPAGRFIDAAIESLGGNRWALAAKSMLNRFNPRYMEIKGNVTDRMLDAYSIAFIATKVRHENINGKDVRFLDDVKLLNVALTGNPINTQAINREVFLKSIESLEDYEQEKKANPDTEKLLEVKSHLIKAGGFKMQTPTETHEEMKESGVHGGMYGKEGGNAPGKEETTSTVSAKAPKDEETSSTTTVAKKAPAKDDETTSTTEVKAALFDLKSRVDALEAENKQLKAVPTLKSPGANMGTMKQAEFEQKSQKKSGGPLDYL